MLVLYPVLVLSVIAGKGIVFAEDAASTPAPVARAAAAENSTTAAPVQTDLPHSPTVAPSKEPAPHRAEDTKANANDNDDAPMSDNYDNDSIDKLKLASTLERITKVLDANPSTAKGTAAVPLLPGKNYDFFLLKVPKHLDEPEKTAEKKVTSRNLDVPTGGNSLSYPAIPASMSSSGVYPPGYCPCVQPPPQIAPDLSALQGIFGNALSFNGMLDQGCPPGMVPAVLPNSIFQMQTMRMMPAIDGIPVTTVGNAFDFNAPGQGFYNQYSPNPVPNYQQVPLNYYPLQSPAFNLNSPAAYAQSAPGLLPFPQNGDFPFSHARNGVGFPSQNGYNPLQYQPNDPYGQSQINAPYAISPNGNNPFQTHQQYPSQYQQNSPDFPISLNGFYGGSEIKSAKSLYR